MEKKFAPVLAKFWDDRDTNPEYWWNRRMCGTGGCPNRILSYGSKCWDHLDNEERKEYIIGIIYHSAEEEGLRGLNLYGVDFSNKNFLFVNFEEADLRNTNFNSSDLRYANLKGASFVGANLSGADLENAELQAATFKNADLRGSNLISVKVGKLGQIQNKALIEKEKGESGEEKLYLRETLISSIEYSTNFSSIKYNPYSKMFLYLAYIAAILFFKKLCNIFRKKERYIKNSISRFKKTLLVGINIIDLDHTKNPQLIRDIRFQQFLFNFRSKKPLWFYRLTYYLWGVTSFFGQSLQLLLFWIFFIIVIFACAYSTEFIVTIKPEIYFQNTTNITFTDALYLSFIIFTSLLGFGDFEPLNFSAKLLVHIEIILGFILLSSLAALIAKNLARWDY